MNFQKLFETQAELDKKIVKEKGLEGQGLLDKKILALQVELGELANEWRGFKFWSENQEPRIFVPNPDDVCKNCKGDAYFNREKDMKEWVFCNECDGCGVHFHNPLLEEYVDCLHFILSIGLEMGFDYINFEKEIEEYDKSGITFKDKTVTAQFINAFHFIAMLEVYREEGSYREMTICFIRLGEMLGFTWEEVEESYFEKNRINHERQNNGY